MQLAAGQTVEVDNKRKGRVGAFWQGRFSTTTVEADDHLVRCITYIDRNMVRANAVEHPIDWAGGGFAEALSSRQRYVKSDQTALARLLGLRSLNALAGARAAWVMAALNAPRVREPAWQDRSIPLLKSRHGEN